MPSHRMIASPQSGNEGDLAHRAGATKCAIVVRRDDPWMSPLYQHLTSLPARRGKRYRAQVVSQVLEVGTAFLFADDRAACDALVRAFRAALPHPATPDVPVESQDALRVAVIPPCGPIADLLVRRLADLSGGRGTQARARLLAQVLQAGVSVLYRGAMTTSGDAPAAAPAAGSLVDGRQPPSERAADLPHGMVEFMDNIDLDGLA